MRKDKTFRILFAGTIFILLAAPFLGVENGYYLGKLFSGQGFSDSEAEIILSLRIPRTIMAFVTGGALSLSGLCLQTVFQNLLATPYTLGIANSAGFGATAAIVAVSLFPWLAGITPFAGAFGATAITLLVILFLVRLRLFHSNQSVIIFGITLNILFSQLTSLTQFLAPSESTVLEMLRWFSGSIPVLSFSEISWISALFIFISGFIYLRSRDLDLLYIGKEFALSKGSNVDKITPWLLSLVSLLVGLIISFTGPIGFIGILEPYLCRVLCGSRHRKLIPAAIMAGGIILVISDLIARTLLYPLEIPVGYLTGVFGGVGIIFILLKNRGLSQG